MRGVPVVEADVEAVEVALAAGGDLGDERLGDLPAFSAASMIGAPCASSAPTKCTSWPCMRWNRTQISAWMYSIMWPMWNAALAYGSAVVTKSRRDVRVCAMRDGDFSLHFGHVLE